MVELLMVVTVFVLLICYWIRWRYNCLSVLNRYGIPGPKPNFFFGTTLKYRKTKGKMSVDMELEWTKQYGKVFGMYFGLRPVILVADPVLLKDILIKDFGKWTNRGPIPNQTDMLVVMKNEKWKNVRNLMSPAFSAAKLKSMFPVMKACIDLFISECKKKSDYADLDIYEHLQALTLDIIGSTALALKIKCQENLEDRTLCLLKNFFGETIPIVPLLSVAFPEFSSIIKLFGKNVGAPVIQKEIENHLYKIYKERRADENAQGNDLFQVLIDAGSQNDGSDKSLTEPEIVANAFMFLFAGFDTTSVSLGYITYCLAKYPDEQNKIVQEIESVIGTQNLTYDNINDIPYLDAFINESLRMYPPVPHFVHRVSQCDQKIGGYSIPEGTMVNVSVYSLHYDSDFWEDPNKFNPSRFLNNKVESCHYMPFGEGPRNCIGKRFALVVIKLCLISLLQNFKILPGSEYFDPFPVEVRTIIMYPEKGVHVKLNVR